jgi:tRNA threonylcarbamoyladenosine biosynthesis protein TsaB
MQRREKVVLGLDTSGSPLLLAVQKNGKVWSRKKSGVKQERLLFPTLNSALQAADAEMEDISRIFIIRGPGRFTGIRISLTFASMLKYLNHTEVRGATLFEALQRQVEKSNSFKKWKKQEPNGVVAVVLHAFREEYFLQFFDDKNQGPAWLTREELLSRLANYPHPLFLAGQDKNHGPLEGLVGNKYTLADAKTSALQPKTLIEMAQDDSLADLALEPLYLKPARFELITPK